MIFSEDRISNLAHEIIEILWRDDLVDVTDQGRALACIKHSLNSFFHVAEEIEMIVLAKLKHRAQRSRGWEALYQKFYQEELARRGL